MNKKNTTYPSFEKYLAKQMRDKEFKKAFEKEGRRLEVAYKILQFRKQKKLSQKELASKLNTTQSVIARMESGGQNFTTDTLQKVADVFGYNLKIDFIK